VEITKIAADFHMAINQSIFNQFQHENAFWKRFSVVSHGKILKNCFFRDGGNFENGGSYFSIFVFPEIYAVLQLVFK
jgi:hypothetical protein